MSKDKNTMCSDSGDPVGLDKLKRRIDETLGCTGELRKRIDEQCKIHYLTQTGVCFLIVTLSLNFFKDGWAVTNYNLTGTGLSDVIDAALRE